MSDHKVEPTTVNTNETTQDNNADHNSLTPSSLPTLSVNQTQPSADNTTINIPRSILNAVVDQQKRRISELEKQLEKKHAKIKRLSSTPPFVPVHPFMHPSPSPHAPGYGTLDPSKKQSPPTSSTAPPTKTPKSSTTQHFQPPSHPVPPTSVQTQSQSHPLPALTQPQLIAQQNPSLTAMAAMAAAGASPLPSQVPLQYPFMYPNPDPSNLTGAMIGVVPSHPLPTPSTTTNPPRAPQTSATNPGESGDRKQSRYWTAEEHQRFLAAVDAYGPKNYAQISELVGTRNPKQVRTHAQKFQKKLEREEARRREARGNAVESRIATVDGATAMAVAAAGGLSAVIPGIQPGLPKASTPIGGSLGPTSSSSAKDFGEIHRQASQSGIQDGSSSDENNCDHDKSVSNQNDDDHAGAAAAAAAAVAAEAAALGGGMVLPGVFPGVANHVDAQTGNTSDLTSHPSSLDKLDGEKPLQNGGNSLSDPALEKDHKAQPLTDGENHTRNVASYQRPNGDLLEKPVSGQKHGQRSIHSSASSNTLKTDKLKPNLTVKDVSSENLKKKVTDENDEVSHEKVTSSAIEITPVTKTMFKESKRKAPIDRTKMKPVPNGSSTMNIKGTTIGNEKQDAGTANKKVYHLDENSVANGDHEIDISKDSEENGIATNEKTIQAEGESNDKDENDLYGKKRVRGTPVEEKEITESKESNMKAVELDVQSRQRIETKVEAAAVKVEDIDVVVRESEAMNDTSKKRELEGEEDESRKKRSRERREIDVDVDR